MRPTARTRTSGLQLCFAQVELHVADPDHHARPLRDAPSSAPFCVADRHYRPANRLPPRRHGDGRQVGDHACELGLGARLVRQRRSVGQLLERQPSLGGCLAEPDDRLLALGVGRALVELAAHPSGIL
jgi:hypothetical protein